MGSIRGISHLIRVLAQYHATEMQFNPRLTDAFAAERLGGPKLKKRKHAQGWVLANAGFSATFQDRRLGTDSLHYSIRYAGTAKLCKPLGSL